MEQRPSCLTVGGSDSCGGAGIQADLRVFAAIGVHGCSAITALTAQNPDHISHIHPTPTAHFSAELHAIADFYPVKSIKTGMLYDEKHLNMLIAHQKSLFSSSLLVVDPVLIASSGKVLFQSEHVRANYADLLQFATVWTPNLQEAAFFLEQPITDPVEAAAALLLQYHVPVLLKGGHGEGDTLCDVFCHTNGDVTLFNHAKQKLNHSQSHGTGCRLASAIAAFLAQGLDLPAAIAQAQRWLQQDLSIPMPSTAPTCKQ